jgi:hypothetical protein
MYIQGAGKNTNIKRKSPQNGGKFLVEKILKIATESQEQTHALFECLRHYSKSSVPKKKSQKFF